MAAKDLPPVRYHDPSSEQSKDLPLERSSSTGREDCAKIQDGAESGGHAGDLTQKLGQRYNFHSLVALMICVQGCWETIVSSLYQALSLGGPTVLVWGFVIAALGAIFVSLSLAEMASAWPTAGGQYHWAAHLATPKWRPMAGFYSAWIVLFALVTVTVSATFAAAQQIISYAYIMNEDFVVERWQTYMVFIGLVLTGLFVNAYAPRLLHHFSLLAMAVHFLGFFAIIITLLVTTEKKNSARTVFGSFENYSGWSNAGISFFIGSLPDVFAFTCLDIPAHYSEEVAHPRVDVPRAVFWSVVANAIVGLPFVIIVAFCMGDTLALLESDIGAINPLAQIILNSTGSPAAAVILCLSVLIVSVVASIDLLGATARTLVAYGRDGAVPFASFFAHLHNGFREGGIPVNACLSVAAAELAIGAIYVGNSTAYFGITNSTVALQMLSYALPILENLLVVRWQNKIQFPKVPWSLGHIGWIVNLIAGIWCCFIVVIMLLPSEMPVTADNMNYASALMAGALVMATVTYFTWGRSRYEGPSPTDVLEGIPSNEQIVEDMVKV